MPIKGLTDLEMKFPKIGDIRKGEPKGKSKFPKDLDYFRVEIDELEVRAKELFLQYYGPEPKKIDIWLPYREIERCWDANYEAYVAGAMIARADGETYQFLRDTEGNMIVKDGLHVETELPVPFVKGEPCAYYKDGKGKKQPVIAKIVGRLEVIVPALERMASLTVHTNSIHDVIQITENLEAIYFINNESLQDIGIELKRKPVMISTPGEGGKRVRREKHLIFVETSPEWIQKQKNGRKDRAALKAPPVAEIEADITAEGIIDGVEIDPPAKEPKRKKKGTIDNPWPTKAVDQVMEHCHINDITEANELLNQSRFTIGKASPSAIEKFAKAFQAGLDQGMKHDKAIEYAKANWQGGGEK